MENSILFRPLTAGFPSPPGRTNGEKEAGNGEDPDQKNNYALADRHSSSFQSFDFTFAWTAIIRLEPGQFIL